MTSKRPDFICLGGGIESLPIISRVHAKGYYPIVLDQNPRCPAAEWVAEHPRTSEFWLGNVYSPTSSRQQVQKKLTWAHKNSRDYDIAGVMCCAVDAPDSQAEVAQALRLPSIGKESAMYGRDKWAQWKKLRDSNVSVPQTIELDINCVMGFEEKDFSIIKPVAGRGARGVKRFNSTNFREYLIDALSQSLPGYKRAIAQQWIDGIQLSTESIICNGQLLFTSISERNYEHLQRYAPHCIENGCDTPFHLNPDALASLSDTLLRACYALGFENCTVKGDVVMADGVFYVIELAPRLSGGLLCSNIIPLAYGVDFVGAAIDLAVGKKVTKVDMSEKVVYTSQRYLFPPEEWIGKKVKSVEAPLLFDLGVGRQTIDDYTTYVRPGDTIYPVTYHGTRLAQSIATGMSRGSAVQRCEIALDAIRKGITVE